MITRRDFLKVTGVAAAAAALTAAGLNADDYKIEVKADETKAEDSTVDADVVIVGAGGAVRGVYGRTPRRD